MGNIISIFLTSQNISFDEHKSELPLYKRQAIERAASSKIKNQKITAFFLTNYALDKAGLQSKDKIIIQDSEQSKPYIKDNKAFFSISHSHEYTACAVCLDTAMGLDIEKSRLLHSFSVAKKLFTQTEYNEFFLLDAQQKSDALIKRWTLYESYLKLDGSGIAALKKYPPAQFLQNRDFYSRADFLADIYYKKIEELHLSIAAQNIKNSEIVFYQQINIFG